MIQQSPKLDYSNLPRDSGAKEKNKQSKVYQSPLRREREKILKPGRFFLILFIIWWQ